MWEAIQLMPSGKAPGLGRFLLKISMFWPELCPVLMPVINSETKQKKTKLAIEEIVLFTHKTVYLLAD